jgi:hypothetical protein
MRVLHRSSTDGGVFRLVCLLCRGCDKRVEFLCQDLCGHNTRRLVHDLALLKQPHRGDRPNTVLRDQMRVVVHVPLPHRGLSVKLD